MIHMLHTYRNMASFYGNMSVKVFKVLNRQFHPYNNSGRIRISTKLLHKRPYFHSTDLTRLRQVLNIFHIDLKHFLETLQNERFESWYKLDSQLPSITCNLMVAL